MLEMSRQAAVFGYRRPAVLFNFNFATSGIDHGLNGQNHSFFQSNSAVRLAVIGHRRFLMQLLADAMTNEGTDNRVARALCSLLNRKAKISQPLSVLELLNAPIKRLFRNFHQALGFVAHPSHSNRDRRVAIEAFVNHPIVEPDDITLTQRSMRRNSMHHLLVNQYTKTPRENSSGYAVTLERRNGLSS